MKTTPLYYFLFSVVALVVACSSDSTSESGDSDTRTDDPLTEPANEDVSDEAEQPDSVGDTTTDGSGLEDTVTDSTVADVDDATEIEGDAPEDEPDVPEISCVPGDPPDRPLAYEADPTFAVGPYLMHTTPTSMVVMWESDEEGLGTVEYGLTDELGLNLAEETAAVIHEVLLDGLDPDTRYSYRVSVAEDTSAIHHFVTPPVPGSPIRFTVWGDSRSLPHNARRVVDSMEDFGPYLNVHVGDVVTDGAVRSQWKDEYFDPMRALAHEVSSYVAIGNHEGNASHFYDYVSYPHPEDQPGHETYFSFTYGNAFFLIVDTNKVFVPILDYYPPQAAWIEEQIRSPEARSAVWRFAFAHHPGYSEGWSPGDCSYSGTGTVRNMLMPLLSEHDFHAFFVGHTHDYERGMFDGLLHIITGGGGSALDEWCVDIDEVTVYESVFQHTRVETTCDTLTIDAIDVDGNIIDHVVLAADQPGVLIEDGVD